MTERGVGQQAFAVMRQVIQGKMVALGRLEFLTPKHAWTCRRTALGGASHLTIDNNIA